MCDSQAAEGDGSLSVSVNIFTLPRLPWLRAYSPDTQTHTHTLIPQHTSTHTQRRQHTHAKPHFDMSTHQHSVVITDCDINMQTHTHTLTLTHAPLHIVLLKEKFNTFAIVCRVFIKFYSTTSLLGFRHDCLPVLNQN